MPKLFRESGPGLLLIGCTLIALILANSSAHTWVEAIWQFPIFSGFTLKHSINEGIMTFFFLVVGLEIRHELSSGHLASPSKAMLPVIAALGGMIFPAIIYGLFNLGHPGLHGWGIPVATDIAFAVGILSMLGKKAPHAMKIFLTALAIADDIGAMIILAFFYSQTLSWIYLGLATGLALSIWATRFWRKVPALVIIALGLGLWICLEHSGISASLAGIILAMSLPASCHHWEKQLSPWVQWAIIPLFVLANAGASLSGNLTHLFEHRISLGIICGLVLGKPLGITLFSWVAVKMKVASLPTHLGWNHMIGLGCLGGIGFTMSLFIAQLAFAQPEFLSLATLSIPVASLLATLLGFGVIYFSSYKGR